MWKRATVIAGTGIAWGVAVSDLFNALPAAHGDSISRFALATALAGSCRLMLWTHTRPIAAAYEMGMERGRREVMREANRMAVVTPIRRATGGVTEFNMAHRKRLNGHKVDA